MNIASLLREAARTFPTRPAISHGDRRQTYREFDTASASFSEWLTARGAGRGERVLLFLDNCPELLVAMFGTFRAGATLVPCNARLTADELAYIAEDCDVRVIVTDAAHRAVAESAVAESAAAGDRIVLTVGDDFDDSVAAAPTTLEPVDVAPDEIAWIFYTSGTTGRPKGAMLPHNVLSFVTVSWLADLTALDERDVTLHAAPLSHGAGFHAIAATARAAHQVIPATTSFDPAALLELIAHEGVTNTWLVPTQIVMLTDAAPADIQLPTLQYVVYGGAPITPAAMSRALERFGPIFVQLFGQGETPMTATVMRRHEHVPELLASAGRARPGIDVRIAGPDGNALEPGEVGELVVRGPSVMAGYWNNPTATAETIRNGWLHTGDLGRMTDDGVFFLLDRAKDMIISGGSNVYAVEVEDVLARHHGVREAAVVGIPHDLWGELVVAVLVPTGDPADFDADDIAAHCRQSLAGYKIPRRYILATALARNAYGKVVKRELRRQIADGELS